MDLNYNKAKLNIYLTDLVLKLNGYQIQYSSKQHLKTKKVYDKTAGSFKSQPATDEKITNKTGCASCKKTTVVHQVNQQMNQLVKYPRKL